LPVTRREPFYFLISQGLLFQFGRQKGKKTKTKDYYEKEKSETGIPSLESNPHAIERKKGQCTVFFAIIWDSIDTPIENGSWQGGEEEREPNPKILPRQK